MIYVKVKRLHPAAKLPAYATSGSAAMDFEAVEIKPCVDSNGAISSSWWVYTGLAMEIPPGWCLKLYPRSGLGCKKHTRLANCVGIIDSDYRGEIMAKLITDPAIRHIIERKIRTSREAMARLDKMDLQFPQAGGCTPDWLWRSRPAGV
nr:probable dUTPase [Escherichia phage D6]